MKISYRTHPVLNMLETRIINLSSASYERIRPMALYSWKMGAEYFSKNIKIFSSALNEAYMQNWRKLLSIEEIELPKEGTIIFSKGRVFCYTITSKQHYVIFEFNEAVLVSFVIYIEGKTEGFTLRENTPLEYFPAVLNSTLSFLKFCPIETKELLGHSRLREIDCKYINDTRANIQFIDSRWFTTLVKSDAFKVRGHFRLQPKKINSQWTKELIWINEFQKDGYTAPARRLKQDEEITTA